MSYSDLMNYVFRLLDFCFFAGHRVRSARITLIREITAGAGGVLMQLSAHIFSRNFERFVSFNAPNSIPERLMSHGR